MVEKETCINPKLRVSDSHMNLKNWTRRLKGICLANGWNIDFLKATTNTKDLQKLTGELIMEAVDGDCGRDYLNHCSMLMKGKNPINCLKYIKDMNNTSKKTKRTEEASPVDIDVQNKLMDKITAIEAIVNPHNNNNNNNKTEYQIMNIIMASVDPDILSILHNVSESAESYFNEINKLFNRATWSSVVSLNEKLRTLTLKKNEQICIYFARAKNLNDSLNAITNERVVNNISFLAIF